MVNVNNYGVNNPNVGSSTPYNNNIQGQNTPVVNNPTYNTNDSYAFNLSNVPAGNVPAVNVVVNGQFGPATEQAVINFKKNVGINDGFLTKKGEYAVTPVVTPQTWNMINAQVASKLNPGGNIASGSYVPPVAAEELNWAK